MEILAGEAPPKSRDPRLYGAGLRVFGLKQRDCHRETKRGRSRGKGGKTRTVRCRSHRTSKLCPVTSDPDAPVFRSRKKGGHTFVRLVSLYMFSFPFRRSRDHTDLDS